MKLNDFFRFVHEKQQVWLCYEGFIVEADGEAMSAVLSEDIYKGIVTAVEAEGDKLKIWAKEE